MEIFVEFFGCPQKYLLKSITKTSKMDWQMCRRYSAYALMGACIAVAATYACDKLSSGPALTAFSLCGLPILTLFLSYITYKKLEYTGLHTFVTHCVICTSMYLLTFSLYLGLCFLFPHMNIHAMIVCCLITFIFAFYRASRGPYLFGQSGGSS